MHLIRYFLVLGALVSTLGAYSRAVPAQTRLWGTYFGGVSKDIDNASKVATDTAGNIYVIGSTESPIGVATPNGFQPQFEDYQLYAPAASAAFLAKFDSTGKLIWATYYNDGPWTEGQDLGLDGRGNVYVLGTAHCPSDKLATPGAYDAGCDAFGHTNMYLAKFDTEGKRLWGTYFGGSGLDSGSALSVTPTGSIYLIGTASSSQGIVPVPSSDSSFGGIRDAVIAKFSSQGQLQWARYYGGENADFGNDIACKPTAPGAGEVCYVTGRTSSNFDIATPGAHDTQYAPGSSDAFVAKISGSNGALIWGSYYGGSGSAGDEGRSVVVDSKLNAYIGGITYSPDAMATMNAHDTTYSGDGEADMFLARFTPSGARVVGTYFGGVGEDWLFDLAMDSSNNLYMHGSTNVESGLTTPNAYDTTYNGGASDAILVMFNSVLMRLRATYYGGSDSEFGTYDHGGVAVDSSNHVYLFGKTRSANSIATPGAHKISPDSSDAFLVEFAQWP